jgi:hypothetical protein
MMVTVRNAYAHVAELAWSGADERAPGGAITEELCGVVDHEGPCPLAPHFTSVENRGDTLEVRVLFACEPADLAGVRARIDTALSRWPVLTSGAGDVLEDEVEHAARLAAS